MDLYGGNPKDEKARRDLAGIKDLLERNERRQQNDRDIADFKARGGLIGRLKRLAFWIVVIFIAIKIWG